MKQKLLLTALLFALLQLTWAQSDYKVVFDLTSNDSMVHKSVMRWVNGISGSVPDSKLEVVMYGPGIFMVTKGRSVVEDAVTKLAASKNVTFAVCGVALKNLGVSKEQLLPGVEVVPDGIYEILLRQREGWGYIKAAQ
jgi:intracellular sulfur oxidation DsrE/DsrF family protein